MAAAIDAVLAVVGAAVRHQHFQQGNASAVGRKAMAAAGDRRRGVADFSRFKPALNTAGRTGCIVFGGVGQYRQLFEYVHFPSSCTAPGIINTVDQTHQVDSDAGSTENHKKVSNSRHGKILPETFVRLHYNSNIRFCQHKIEQIF